MNLWQLTHSNARLTASSLQATADVSNPSLGMHDLTWNGNPVVGNLMGVTVAEGSAHTAPLSAEGIDHFIRGSDLVANYPQGPSQRFSLQMYWRIVNSAASLTVIDVIVSLQTSLLECFPKAVLTTLLPQGEVLAISLEDSSLLAIEDQLTSDEPAGVLVRCDNRPWSYFEMTHPTDLGCWRVTSGSETKLERELGGEFQEKGVIRRLRVRGAFLSRDKDLQVTQQLMAEFAHAEPPLTA